MKPYRLVFAATGWFAVVTQYELNITQDGFIHGSIVYFSFFTILSNILVALALTVPTPAFQRPGLRTAIAVYILVVATIYYLLLRKIYHPTGLGWYVNILLHYIMPPAYILDWALFVPKRNLRFSQIPYWLIFPLLYAAWTLIHGAASGFYPYPFLNVTTYGYPRVLLNILGLTAVFVILSLIFTGLGRTLSRNLARS